MNRIISLVFITIFICLFNPLSVKAEGYDVGYSTWSEVKSDNVNEVSAIQYGKKLPLTWSSWSTTKSDSKFQIEKEEKTDYYAFNTPNQYNWNNVVGKPLYTWNFGSSVRVVGFYANVETYFPDPGSIVQGTYYLGPPLELYCDGTLIKSIDFHDYQSDWNPSIDCNCQTLQLKMRDGKWNGSDRSITRTRTRMSNTKATISKKMYSYVTSWDNGSGWRFNTKYSELYGKSSQIPTQRTVYSYPLTYKIDYELDGGTVSEPLITSYTVLDEFDLPVVTKSGYEFLGFYSGGIKYTKISKGTYGNLKLSAKFERKKATLIIGPHQFKKEDKQLTIDELLKLVHASAIDEYDGDITKNIKVDNITYLSDDDTINDPEYFDISKAGKVTITFSITNSGGLTTVVIRNFYILGDHQISDLSKEDIRISTRYINYDYNNTLDQKSVWRQSEYQELLESKYIKMKGVD